MKCKICGETDTKEIFEGKILGKYSVKYYFCENCEHLQTEEPYWLDEAYSYSITDQDTGVMKRNLDNTVKTTSVIASFFDIEAKFLDFAGGYGVFTRLMRDNGFDFYWADKYSKNLFARGFEAIEGIKYELLTAFEILEHLNYPMDEIEKMFNYSDNIFFTQTLLPDPLPNLGFWWYYAPESGQHVSFYTNKTLDFIAKHFNKKHLNFGQYHLFTSLDIDNEDFACALINDSKVYIKTLPKLTSKIASDMQFIIKKKSAD